MKRGCLLGSMRYSIAGSFTARAASSARTQNSLSTDPALPQCPLSNFVHLYITCLIQQPTLTTIDFLAASDLCMLLVCPPLALLLYTLHMIEAGEHATSVLLCGKLQAHRMLSACMSGQWHKLAARIQTGLMLDAHPADLMLKHISNTWYLVLQAPM